MSSLIAAVSGDDAGTTRILIDHINDIRDLLNGTTAYLVKLIANDNVAFDVDPATSGYVATNTWFRLLDNADAEVLSIRYNGQIRSSLGTGTAPFVVASTTAVTNLNADLLDGQHAPAGNIVGTTGPHTLALATLTAPTIADFTNAGHAHNSAATGGNAIPAGAILAYAAATAPTGYLLCNGAAVSRTTYAALFTAISTTYGTGDGSTTFNVPDLRGRFPLGVDGAAARITSNDTLGASSGTEDHNHAVVTSSTDSGTPDTGSGGGNPIADSPHDHTVDLPAMVALPPYQVVEYIIKT